MQEYPMMRVVEYQVPEPVPNPTGVPRSCWSSGLRKYVFLCTACGSLSIVLGALFLIVYFMLKSYTSSLNYFETIPTYVPSGMLVATGFLIICLAWRKNRNNFLMKLCGLCSLCCAVLCVSVTVTTTVIHMNRLQILRECLYTQKTQSCTCYSMVIDNNRISDEGIKFVFNSTPDCEVIHGALYSCLRAVFGLSVIGILVCIFGCMLVYQLLSHEKKKMYWAQLEMRCRYLYRQQRNPHYYTCCDECRYPPQPQLFPWDFTRNRFWSTGRIGNLYTPNPEDRGNHQRLRSGWNWRRLPWTRNGGADGTADPSRGGNPESPDSQYGFSSSTVEGAPYTVLDPRAANGIPICPPNILGADVTEGGFYSWGPPPPYASNRNSVNNSPARRSLGELFNQMSPVRRNDNVSPARSGHHIHCHHMHHSRRCASSPRPQIVNGGTNIQPDSYQKSTPLRNVALTNIIQQDQPIRMNALWSNSLSSVHRLKPVISHKDNYENMYEMEAQTQLGSFNTLPSLKSKNQTRANNLFSDESFAAYFFSSTNSGGGSTSNNEFQDVSGVGRVSPTNEQQPNVSRNGPGTEAPIPTAPNKLEKSNQLLPLYGDGETTSVEPSLQSVSSLDSNISVVKKLLVHYSPRQKQKMLLRDLSPSEFEKQHGNQTTSKKVPDKATRTEKKQELLNCGTNENVITFHYKTSLPVSMNSQNLSKHSKKSSESTNLDRVHGKENSNKIGSEKEFWLNERVLDSVIPSSADCNEKTTKGSKYMMRDSELLKKHKNLIQEFKTLDLGKSLQKTRDNKLEEKKILGIENEAYQLSEETSPFQSAIQYDSRTHHAKTYATPFRQTGNENSPVSLEDGRTNEARSDVSIGDPSDVDSYGPESILQGESGEDLGKVMIFSPASTLHVPYPLLDKHNSKVLGLEGLKPKKRLFDSTGHQVSEPSKYLRHQNSGMNNQHQSKVPAEEKTGRTVTAGFPKSDCTTKNQRQTILDGQCRSDPPESQTKYSSSLSSSCSFPDSRLLHSTRRRELTDSIYGQSHGNVQKSSDPGISPEKNPEFECRFRNGELVIQNLASKRSNFESLGDFVHPLFQKPKIFPRGNHYREGDLVHARKTDSVVAEPSNDSKVTNPKPRTHHSKAISPNDFGETPEEVSNQLLSTCNLTLTSSYLSEEENTFLSYLTKREEIDQTTVHNNEEISKLPKPLPRTSFSNKVLESELSGERGCAKSSKTTMKKDRFLAPDAQYDVQEDSDPETMSKSSQGPSTGKTKPTSSSRPSHTSDDSKKSGKQKCSNANQTRRTTEGNENVRPVPKGRRKTGLDDADAEEPETGTGNHSVNV